MKRHESIIRQQATFEALQNLEETISGLLELCASLPAEDSRDKFLDQIGALDSVTEDIRRTFDSMQD